MKNMSQPIPCPLCGTSEYSVVLDQPDALYFPRGFVRCAACGLVYVNPQPTPQQLEELYNNELSGRERRLAWDRKLNDYTLREKAPESETAAAEPAPDQSTGAITPAQRRARLRAGVIRGLCPPPGRVLDIGCRGGEFLLSAKTAGYSVEGIEISSRFAAEAARRTRARVFNGALEKYAECMPEKINTFDIVTMWDVLEHLLDPVAEIRKIGRLQREGGLLGISTVNLTNYRYRRYGPRWRGFIEGQEHTMFFSPVTIAMLLRKCGYEPLKILTRAIPPVTLRWLNLFKLGNDLEVFAKKSRKFEKTGCRENTEKPVKYIPSKI